MKELLIILVSSAIVNNVVLSQFLGLCPFLGVSKSVETAAGMGGAIIFVITLSSFVTGIIYNAILVPTNLTYLQTIVFILLIAALVQFVEMFLKKAMPSLYQALGVYLPLITTNCAVLGVALTNVQKGYNILQGTVNGFATAVGFTISIVLMAGIHASKSCLQAITNFCWPKVGWKRPWHRGAARRWITLCKCSSQASSCRWTKLARIRRCKVLAGRRLCSTRPEYLKTETVPGLAGRRPPSPVW